VRGIRARISDNVLDEEDWSVWKLVFAAGRVRRADEEHKGVYDQPMAGFEGMTIQALSKWTEHDDTGFHLENYYELEIRGSWKDRVSVEEIEEELCRAT
jgi:hypothetical protein